MKISKLTNVIFVIELFVQREIWKGITKQFMKISKVISVILVTNGLVKRGYLERHIKTVHRKIKSHKCGSCNWAIGQNCDLKRHNVSRQFMEIWKIQVWSLSQKLWIKRKYDNTQIEIFQTWCILIFDKWNLETKELYAWKEEGAFLSCYQCGTRFALNTNLKNHSKNEKLRGNQCKSCEKSFPSGRYLGNPHISIVHLVDDGLRLLKCIHFI